MPSTVYVVHCIDTEGPLHESVTATFERLKAIFNLELEPGAALLRRLQAGEVDLGGIEAAVQKVVDPHLLAYNDTWDKVDAMLTRIMSTGFRQQQPDSSGGGWVYSWFCLDHIGYGDNPRRRDLGYLNVFDHYQAMLRETGSHQDGVYFHFHPHNFRHEAHRCATHWWAASDTLFQVLSRRVIERRWFPAANRPGFHVIRPDSHWFLEQFIPFDYSSQAMVQTAEDTAQFGLRGGRFGDWRRAPVSWAPYHPAADDYQVPGDCRRWIARCLNVGTRFRLITEADVRQAFEEARAGGPVVLSVTNHDFRDMAPDVDEVRGLLHKVAADYPDVPFRYADAVAAMRGALALPPQPPCELDISINAVDAHTHVMVVESATPTFGPQPWLALKTLAGTYHHDNFDIDIPFHRWQYVFDAETVPLAALSAVGVAANNAYGTTTVAVLDPASGEVARQHWNLPVSP
ncbi:MAG: hypothetical protein R3F42_14920 [Pseudomonadota bacterium]